MEKYNSFYFTELYHNCERSHMFIPHLLLPSLLPLVLLPPPPPPFGDGFVDKLPKYGLHTEAFFDAKGVVFERVMRLLLLSRGLWKRITKKKKKKKNNRIQIRLLQKKS